LFLLPGFVDDEGGSLGFLLRDLFGFDRGGEFGGEGEVLDGREVVGLVFLLVLFCCVVLFGEG
jgi:hypothetical protein